MKKLLVVLMLLVPTAVVAQTAGLAGFCELGAAQASTSGLKSTNYLQGIVPKCLVTVFLTGSTTKATIYSDGASDPLSNPFTADKDGSFLFFAAQAQGYDVQLSGGIYPNVYLVPRTITDVFVGSRGGGTITGVIAGTGLSGGGTSGVVTVSLTTPVTVANGGTGGSGTGYAYGNGASAFTYSTTIPYSALTSTPTIPSSANWPGAGNCPTNDYMTAITNGAIPTCSQVAYSQISGVPGVFTSSTNGLAPASGGGAVNYLRADGTWDAPPNSGGTVTSFAAPAASWPSWLVPTVTNPTTTPSLAAAASAIPNSALANAATTVNGQTCALGGSCTVTATATGIIVGTTTVTSGTSGDILYDNGGTLGDLPTTGSGSVVLATSPNLVTPNIGAASAQTINGAPIEWFGVGNANIGGSLPLATTGSNNTANGQAALYSNTTGNSNTANGFDALLSNTTGSNNTANGVQALYFNTGNNNTANGEQALYSNTTGNNNTANGEQALFSNTTGTNNNANGETALYSNTTGIGNTANGQAALFSNTTGNTNTANGYQALYFNATGNNNTANGEQALYSNTTGSNNTANGPAALYSNTTGSNNTANGQAALFSNTTGIGNTANGYGAGQYIADGVTANQTSSNSVYEGYQAYPLANGDTNENVIGNAAIGHGSNTTTIGNSSVTDTYLAGMVHATIPTFTFTTSTSVVGANTCSGTTTVSAASATSTSVFTITPNADTSGATGWGATGGLVLDVWPTSGTLNYKICNQSGTSITPVAVTFNVGVL